MRLLVVLLTAGCSAPPAPGTDGVVTDSLFPGGGSRPERVGQGGLGALRLGRTVLALGLNNRRLGSGMSWSLAPDQAAGFDADVARLAPAVLRFPGGTVGEYYDWDGRMSSSTAGKVYDQGDRCPPQGGIDPNETEWQPFLPVKQVANVYQPDPDTLDSLSAELPQGAQVDFLLNLLTRAAGSQIQLLETAAAKPYQLAIDRVELGNEFYYDGDTADGSCKVFRNAFPGARHYAATAKVWAAKVHAKFPAARIAAVAREAFQDSGCEGEGWTRDGCWNHDLLAEGVGDDVHALVIHPYVWHRGACPSGADMYDGPDNLIGGAMQMASALLDENSGGDPARGLLPVSLKDWKRPIWVTEYGYLNYGANGGDTWSRSWAAGLAVLAYAMRLTADPRITVLLHHNVTDLIWPPGGAERGLTGRGVALAELDAALAEAQPTVHDDMWQLDFSRTGAQYEVAAACGYDGKGPLRYHALIGRWFTRGYDRRSVRGSTGLVVNLGRDSVELDLAGYYGEGGARAEVLTAPPDSDPDDAVHPVARTTHHLDARHHRLTLPARAILHFHDLTP